MHKTRDYCFRHATMYDGWACPRCVDEGEQNPSGAPAVAGAAGEGAPAAGPAAAADPVTPSPAESRSKSARAEAVLLAGTPIEAVDLCDAAIELDPKNLQAYRVGAEASRMLGDTVRADELVAQAIVLLQGDEAGRSTATYGELLRHATSARVIGQLVRAFLEVQPWSTADLLAMAGALIGRDAPSDALVVLDSIPAASRSLLTCAHTLQLSPVTSLGTDPEMLRYLEAVPGKDRERVLGEYFEIGNAAILTGPTISRVKAAIRARYAGWSPDIRRLLGDEARRIATERVNPTLDGAALAFAVRFLFGGVALGLGLAFVGGPAGAFIGALAALGSAGAGYVYGRDVELKRRLDGMIPAVREELTDREVERWAPVLSEEPVAPSQPHTEGGTA
jgi:hypothetical protein